MGRANADNNLANKRIEGKQKPNVYPQIPTNTLEAFLNQTEAGYCKHRNLYHNNTHAADVSQTLHYMLYQTGLMVSDIALDTRMR